MKLTDIQLKISSEPVDGFWCFSETSLVADYMIEIWTKDLLNFIVKFGSKAEICWKSEELKWNFLNNSEVSSYFFGHILLFWKVTMQAFQKFPSSVNFCFEKYLVGQVVYKSGRGCLGRGTFLVPPILIILYLYSKRTKFSEYDVLSCIRYNI